MKWASSYPHQRNRNTNPDGVSIEIVSLLVIVAGFIRSVSWDGDDDVDRKGCFFSRPRGSCSKCAQSGCRPQP